MEKKKIKMYADITFNEPQSNVYVPHSVHYIVAASRIIVKYLHIFRVH